MSLQIAVDLGLTLLASRFLRRKDILACLKVGNFLQPGK